MGEVDWSKRGEYMQFKHNIAPFQADEAVIDPNRVVIDPDYNSKSGTSIRIIGYSTTLEQVITVIVVEHEGVTYGVNGWLANAKDQRYYREEQQ